MKYLMFESEIPAKPADRYDNALIWFGLPGKMFHVEHLGVFRTLTH
jgi:hypothetical protein